jgi:hypothetical protein
MAKRRTRRVHRVSGKRIACSTHRRTRWTLAAIGCSSPSNSPKVRARWDLTEYCTVPEVPILDHREPRSVHTALDWATVAN